MKLHLSRLLIVFFATQTCWGQTALDGVSFNASTYNLPGSVGSVRLIDVGASDCRVDGGPVGDDLPGEACLVEDSGVPPVSITFNAGPQMVGDLLVTPTVTAFSGVEGDPIVATNNTTQASAPLPSWSTPGDLIEFLLATPDGTFPSADEEDYWGFSATGIQYPNALPDSEVSLPFEEELENYTNFYFWFEDKDGPITSGYDIFLPVGLGVGRHPLDPDREVMYPFYSRGQADEQTDTVAGGSLDFHSHGSILDDNPAIGNILFLADNTGVEDGLEVTGFGLALLVVPPEMEAGLPGDFDGDGVLTPADINLLSAADASDTGFDLNGDGAVGEPDRQIWITDLANTVEGDADLNRAVEFADFLLLSANFGKAGGWAEGDFDGSQDIQFADFLLLSSNFGTSTAAAVPEPCGWKILLLGVGVACLRRRRATDNR